MHMHTVDEPIHRRPTIIGQGDKKFWKRQWRKKAGQKTKTLRSHRGSH